MFQSRTLKTFARRELWGHSYKTLAPIVVFALAWIDAETGFFERFENLTIDWRFQTRAQLDPPANPNLILVAIDGQSLKKFGKWPWSRTVHGEFLQLLSKSDPAVVSF